MILTSDDLLVILLYIHVCKFTGEASKRPTIIPTLPTSNQLSGSFLPCRRVSMSPTTSASINTGTLFPASPSNLPTELPIDIGLNTYHPSPLHDYELWSSIPVQPYNPVFQPANNAATTYPSSIEGSNTPISSYFSRTPSIYIAYTQRPFTLAPSLDYPSNYRPLPTFSELTSSNPTGYSEIILSPSPSARVIPFESQHPSFPVSYSTKNPFAEKSSNPLSVVISLAPSTINNVYCNYQLAKNRVGDGWCDAGEYQGLNLNGEGCQYDGGDCCLQTCNVTARYSCGTAGYNCLNPFYQVRDILPQSTSLPIKLDQATSITSLAAISENTENVQIASTLISRVQTLTAEETGNIIMAIVNMTQFYTNQTQISILIREQELILDSISGSILNGGMERSIRLVSKKTSNRLNFVLVCGSFNVTYCAEVEAQGYVKSQINTVKNCPFDSSSWRYYYSTPDSFPVYLALLFLYLLAWIILLIILIIYKALGGFNESIDFYSIVILTCLIRIVYFGYIIVETVYSSIAISSIACVELSFLDNSGPIWYSTLVAIFYPSFVIAVMRHQYQLLHCQGLLLNLSWSDKEKAKYKCFLQNRMRVSWVLVIVQAMVCILRYMLEQSTSQITLITLFIGQTLNGFFMMTFAIPAVFIVLAFITYIDIRNSSFITESYYWTLWICGALFAVTAIPTVMYTPSLSFFLYSIATRAFEVELIYCIVLYQVKVERQSSSLGQMNLGENYSIISPSPDAMNAEITPSLGNPYHMELSIDDSSAKPVYEQDIAYTRPLVSDRIHNCSIESDWTKGWRERGSPQNCRNKYSQHYVTEPIDSEPYSSQSFP